MTDRLHSNGQRIHRLGAARLQDRESSLGRVAGEKGNDYHKLSAGACPCAMGQFKILPLTHPLSSLSLSLSLALALSLYTHTHTHTYKHIDIMCVCVCVNMYYITNVFRLMIFKLGRL
jgi:hypothetical protein